jgi:FtsZ-binding cell division protein ZapB
MNETSLLTLYRHCIRDFLVSASELKKKEAELTQERSKAEDQEKKIVAQTVSKLRNDLAHYENRLSDTKGQLVDIEKLANEEQTPGYIMGLGTVTAIPVFIICIAIGTGVFLALIIGIASWFIPKLIREGLKTHGMSGIEEKISIIMQDLALIRDHLKTVYKKYGISI